MAWRNAEGTPPSRYTCGWCDNVVASALGYRTDKQESRIQICPNCSAPTLFQKSGALQAVG